MAKILNWISVQQKLKEKGLMIFSLQEIRRLFDVSKTAVHFFVHRNTKKGLLVRLKKSQKGSLYALADNTPHEYLVANRLYQPSYVSLDTALSFHGMIPETIYSITSVTTKATRSFTAAGIHYQYFRIKKEAFTGYRPIKYKNLTILMADPEKALLDYLYLMSFRGRTGRYERLDLKKINRRRLKSYIKLFSRTGLSEEVQKIYAHGTADQRIY